MALTGTFRPGDVPEGLRVTTGGAVEILRDGPRLVAYAGRLDTRRLAHELAVEHATPLGRLLAVASERGLSSLASLRGQFALLFWDADRQSGFLGTDQLGARSVFFSDHDGVLSFGLDVRDLLTGASPAPDGLAVARWIVDGFLDRDQTLFEGIRRLPGGHVLQLDGSGWRMEQYWTPELRPVVRLAYPDLTNAVRSAVVEAVGSRLIPGATAVLVSGGVDSSTVAAAARAAIPAGGDAFRLYSFGFPEHPTTDERQYIDLIREKVAAPAAAVEFTRGSALAGGLTYIEEWRLPPATPMLSFALSTLGMAAEDGNVVVLDGEGGDELFGCDLYLVADLIRKGRLLSARRLIERIHGRPSPMPARVLLRALRSYGVVPALPRRVLRLRSRFRQHEGPPLLSDEMRSIYIDAQDRPGWTERHGPRWWADKSHRLTVSREEVGAYDLLRHRAALAGLMSAHPLFDDIELVELSLRLPPELSFDPVLSRPLLREAMRGLVPEEIRLRTTKTNFGPVVRQALTEWDRPLIDELLGHPQPQVAAYVDLRFMRERILAESAPRDGFWGWQVWRLLMIECWLRTLEDASFASRLRDSGRLLPPELRALRTR